MTIAQTFGRTSLQTAAVLLAAGIVVGAIFAMTSPDDYGSTMPREWIDRFVPLPSREAAMRMATQFAILLAAAVIGHVALRRRP